MEQQVSINLLKTQSVLSASENVLLKRLRLISIGFFIAVITSGLFVATAFIAAQVRLTSLEENRTTLMRRIALQARKEILVKTLKERLPAIERVIENQYPWDSILAEISAIALPPVLKTVMIDNDSLITFSISSESFEEIEIMTQKLMQMAVEKKIEKPGIGSLNLSKEGMYEVSMYFTPMY